MKKILSLLSAAFIFSCGSHDEEQMQMPTPPASSFTEGSRLEWRMLIGDDGSKIPALMPPRFWDKQRKEPCDLDFVSKQEEKLGIYRCLPFFEESTVKDGKYIGDATFADSNCLQPILFFKNPDIAKTYPGKYRKLAIGGDSNTAYFFEMDNATSIKDYYKFDVAKTQCVATQRPDGSADYTPLRGVRINPYDFVSVSYK